MKKRRIFVWINILSLLFIISNFCNCGKDDENPDDGTDPGKDDFYAITIDPSITYQEMIGFGGALSWYCDRITSSSKKDEITQFLFNDLGADIIRLKNWYYPVDYPTNKTADVMEISWFKQHFDATNELFAIAKQKDPKIKVLFSSWGPPSALKSNASTRSGTLKKDNGIFMYEEYATYWEDILNNISFNPEYLSIQNEPSYVNDGWETCEWRPTETPDFPGYDVAFDMVYDKIKNRTNPPVLIGPESANIGNSSFGNTFSTFADAIKEKPYLEIYAYHPYNFNESSSSSAIASALSMIKNGYSDRSNIMTEYSGMSWLKTAQFINSTLKNANSSGYIYWEMMWDENSDNAMVKIGQNGSYELTPFYYLIKHYAKYVDEGCQRIDLGSEHVAVDAVAFISPAGDRIVTILINPNLSAIDVKIAITNHQPTITSGWQSLEDDNYKEMQGLSIDQALSLAGKSITTIVLGI